MTSDAPSPSQTRAQQREWARRQVLDALRALGQQYEGDQRVAIFALYHLIADTGRNPWRFREALHDVVKAFTLRGLDGEQSRLYLEEAAYEIMPLLGSGERWTILRELNDESPLDPYAMADAYADLGIEPDPEP